MRSYQEDVPAGAQLVGEQDPDERLLVLDLLHRYGAHATSFQILERGLSYWFDAREPNAVVAYVDAAGTWLAAGPPIADPERLGEAAEGFVLAAARSGRRAAFFSADDAFLDALRTRAPALRFDALAIGEQADFEPTRYGIAGASRRTLRAQIHRAINKGVRVRRVPPREIAAPDAPHRHALDALIARWLSTRRMGTMRFMVDLAPFEFPDERRYYLAEHAGRIVGLLVAVPVYARSGWFFEDILRDPHAPNGTAELLVHEAIEDAAREGSTYVSLGLSPLSGIAEGPGPHRILRSLLRFSYLHLGALYRFSGVRAFKARFRPDRWSSQYLVSCPPPAGARTLVSVLVAFTGNRPLGFALATARRLIELVPPRFWAAILFLLAVLLVPWTILLALADTKRWFGASVIQWAWVGFDVIMIASFIALGRAVLRQAREACALARLLCVATALDATLTTLEAFFLPRTLDGWAFIVVIAAISGPVIATTVLFSITLRRVEDRDGPVFSERSPRPLR